MDISKIKPILQLNWIKLKVEAEMYALVPRNQFNSAEAHGFICETESGAWRCAGIDVDGSMMELGIVPRRIDARQAVQKQVIRVNSALAKAKVDDFECPNGCNAETEDSPNGTICGVCGGPVTAIAKEVEECPTT